MPGYGTVPYSPKPTKLTKTHYTSPSTAIPSTSWRGWIPTAPSSVAWTKSANQLLCILWSTPCSSSSTEMPVPSNYVPAPPKYPPLDVWLSPWGLVLNHPDTGKWFQKCYKTNDSIKEHLSTIARHTEFTNQQIDKVKQNTFLKASNPAFQQSSRLLANQASHYIVRKHVEFFFWG